MHVKNRAHYRLHDDGAAHLPDRKGSTLDEVLDAVGKALVDELGSQTSVRHALEDLGFDFGVNDFASELAIKEIAWCIPVLQCHFLTQSDAVACVAEAAKSSDTDLVD